MLIYSNQLFNLFKIAKNTKELIKALNKSVWESVIEYKSWFIVYT